MKDVLKEAEEILAVEGDIDGKLEILETKRKGLERAHRRAVRLKQWQLAHALLLECWQTSTEAVRIAHPELWE